MKKSLQIIGILFIFAFLLGSGCTTIISNRIEAQYDMIHSYPGGGGIIPIYLNDTVHVDEPLLLEISADENLHAHLSQDLMTDTTRTAELLIRPDMNITPGIYPITISSSTGFFPRRCRLNVEIKNVNIEEPGPYIQMKKGELLSWLESNHEEFTNISNQTWFSYRTYPDILVVEHWTFLNNHYELRICCHITIPPHNWSKLWIRPRGELDPVLAAHQEYDGQTEIIPVSEYPKLYGY